MSAATFTPGPWTYCVQSEIRDGLWEDAQITVDSTEGPIAQCFGCTRVDANNARLIAAAPELLDMLRQLRDYLSCIPESAAGGDDDAVILTRNADKLITKATGINQ